MSRRIKKSRFSFSATHAVILFGLTTFFMGIIAAIMITRALAQTSDTNQIYACVNNINGSMRMVTSEEPCKNNENSVKWSIQGPPGPPGPAGDTGGLNEYFGLPFFCYNCSLSDLGDRFAEKDFSYAQIVKSIFNGADMHGVKFTNAYLRSNEFNDTNLSNADFSNMQTVTGLSNSKDNYFSNSNLSGASFENSIVQDSTFTNANLFNLNLSNATIKSTTFQGATGMSSANINGATWDNVTCPDGTKSTNNGNTCQGHF